MSGPIRSAPLFVYRSAGSTGGVTVYTGPANTTTLFKSAYFFANNAAPTELRLYVQGGPSSYTVRLLDLVPTSLQLITWSGWIALNPGDVIGVFTNDAQIIAWGSGAVLPGVVTIT